MFGRLLRTACVVLAIAIGFVTPVLTTAEPSSAYADTVINGCTIVSNPTATNFTNCPGTDLSSADLSGVDLSYADLAGARFADCTGLFTFACNGANLNGANLTDANISNAHFFTSVTAPPPGTGSGFAVASLENADLTGINATGADLSYVDLADANLTDANLTNAGLGANVLTGITLSGANVTGTGFVPTTQITAATSDAGAVATWMGLVGVPGVTSGPCTWASGSTFPVGTTTVSCELLDSYGNAATGTFQIIVEPTVVVLPSDNDYRLSGVANLDATAFAAAGIKAVVFELTGGSFTNQVVATATSTLYGWLAHWNTTAVANGTYTLQSVATDADNATLTSPVQLFEVNNSSPATNVLYPSGGATVSGTSAVVNASAAQYVTSVTYELFGGPSNLNGQVIATGTPTYYGWLSHWDTTTVPNGTYSLGSVAAYAGGQQGFSTRISITVNNPLPSTSILNPSKASTLTGSTPLDASASNATSVKFLLFGGTYGFSAPVVCTATPTIYGWICGWNTTTVPNGSYVLVSEALNTAGDTFSSGVNVTVSN
jgi:hypothetical protein